MMQPLMHKPPSALFSPCPGVLNFPAFRSGKILIFALITMIQIAACANASSRTQGEKVPEEAFSIIVLPDTQIYAWQFPEIFHQQTEWVAENLDRYNIRYVLHVGDVVQHNTRQEWEIARKAFSRLDGKVPYAIALGNHDLGSGGQADTRRSMFTTYFPLNAFRKWPTWGGVYDKEPERGDNSYHLFSAGGRDWLVLILEFGPRDDVLKWADRIVSQHPDRSVILVTHAYLDSDGRRFTRGAKDQHYPPYAYPLEGSKEGLNGGEEMWQKLVSKHGNMMFVISGHVCIASRLVSKGKAGNAVWQMLVNYQTEERGGTGWLRLMRFNPDTETVSVQDYSPVLDQWAETPNRRFDLHLPSKKQPK